MLDDCHTVCADTPLALTNLCIRLKKVDDIPATDKQMNRLQAIHRVLLQVDAVHTTSWRWSSNTSFVAHAGEQSRTATMTSHALMVMRPIVW